jgi:hypothetical protein
MTAMPAPAMSFRTGRRYHARAPQRPALASVLLGCAAIYVIHAVFYFRTRNARAAILLYLVLLALLFCNVSGCRSMINAR